MKKVLSSVVLTSDLSLGLLATDSRRYSKYPKFESVPSYIYLKSLLRHFRSSLQTGQPGLTDLVISLLECSFFLCTARASSGGLINPMFLFGYLATGGNSSEELADPVPLKLGYLPSLHTSGMSSEELVDPVFLLRSRKCQHCRSARSKNFRYPNLSISS